MVLHVAGIAAAGGVHGNAVLDDGCFGWAGRRFFGRGRTRFLNICPIVAFVRLFRNAQLWIKGGKCKTKLAPTRRNEKIFELIDRAEKWLAVNKVTNPILKWETEAWGEIPADFGRK